MLGAFMFSCKHAHASWRANMHARTSTHMYAHMHVPVHAHTGTYQTHRHKNTITQSRSHMRKHSTHNVHGYVCTLALMHACTNIHIVARDVVCLIHGCSQFPIPKYLVQNIPSCPPPSPRWPKGLWCAP